MVALSVIDCAVVTAIFYHPGSKPLPQILRKVLGSRLMDYLCLEKLPKRPGPATVMAVLATGNQSDKSNGHEDSKDYLARNRTEIGYCHQPPMGHDAKNPDADLAGKEDQAWQILATFVERVFLICYVTSLAIGCCYYYHLVRKG